MGQFDSLEESISCPKIYLHWGVSWLTNPKLGNWDSHAESTGLTMWVPSLIWVSM